MRMRTRIEEYFQRGMEKVGLAEVGFIEYIPIALTFIDKLIECIKAWRGNKSEDDIVSILANPSRPQRRMFERRIRKDLRKQKIRCSREDSALIVQSMSDDAKADKAACCAAIEELAG